MKYSLQMTKNRIVVGAIIVMAVYLIVLSYVNQLGDSISEHEEAALWGCSLHV